MVASSLKDSHPEPQQQNPSVGGGTYSASAASSAKKDDFAAAGGLEDDGASPVICGGRKLGGTRVLDLDEMEDEQHDSHQASYSRIDSSPDDHATMGLGQRDSLPPGTGAIIHTSPCTNAPDLRIPGPSLRDGMEEDGSNLGVDEHRHPSSQEMDSTGVSHAASSHEDPARTQAAATSPCLRSSTPVSTARAAPVEGELPELPTQKSRPGGNEEEESAEDSEIDSSHRLRLFSFFSGFTIFWLVYGALLLITCHSRGIL